MVRIPTIKEAVEIVLQESRNPVLWYRTITHEIEKRWPGIFKGDTPWFSVNVALWELVSARVVQTFRKQTGKFYLRAREHEVVGNQLTMF